MDLFTVVLDWGAVQPARAYRLPTPDAPSTWANSKKPVVLAVACPVDGGLRGRLDDAVRLIRFICHVSSPPDTHL